ncbi:MAG: hypothetical protein CL609_18205 [Anaerolineaceae bacterium]|nr:hypothetical protein [Anaerolineaceae bacterium]
METFVALFRGINVGGHNKIPMAELVTVLQQLGLENVRTYIQSGNIVFNSRKTNHALLIDQIRSAVQLTFGFKPAVLIFETERFEKMIRMNPFPQAEGEPKTLHLYFLEKPAHDPDISKLENLKKRNEQYKLFEHVFYLYAPDGIGRSKLAAGVEKALGVPVTARNWRTVNKIVEMTLR